MSRIFLFINPLLLFIISSIFVYLGIMNAWFGDVREGVMLFCEYARDGHIKQPSNSFSNFAFSISGLMVAWFVYKNKIEENNRFSNYNFYPMLYSASLILIGAGSFAMHATNAPWGGFFDLFAMYLFSSFLCSYAISRWFKLSNLFFIIFFIINLSIGIFILLAPSIKMNFILSLTDIWFGSQLIVAFIFELFLKYKRKITIHSTWGWAGVLTLIFSFIIWNLSRTHDSIFCNPHSLFQGHALWHILDAIAAYFVFRFYVSESEIEPA